MSERIAAFEIHHQKHLDEQGEPTQALPAFAEDEAHCQAVYRMMVYTRAFDRKAIALQRTGQLGTYPSTMGQEAISVGVGAAMRPEDVLCPYYREYGAQFWRGVKPHEIYRYWGGDEEGSNFQAAREDFPICVPIASQTLHAVGVASAMQYRQEPRVAVALIGDGGTSRGDFYEAMNVAGAWSLPVVFVVNNNQWAISVPRATQSEAETLAQKGLAAGISGIQIDGNDVVGVQAAMEAAIEKARRGDGPSVIEAMTYRMCDHTTADDAKRYRPDGELESHKPLDPISRFRNFMAARGYWDESKEKALLQSIQAEIADEVTTYLNTPKKPPSRMLAHLYETLPAAYQAQWDELAARGASDE